MGISKGLLLGSAAAMLMATGSAFAADLPSRKAAPVAYVKICDVYGRGFYYIPGTNTCLRVGGRVRVEYRYRHQLDTYKNTALGVGSGPYSARTYDTIGWKARAYVNMDARTQTAWGTVQAVFSISLRSRSGLVNAGANNGPGSDNTASPQVYAAFIRFAGFTFGRAPHTFSSGPGFLFYTTNYSGGGAIGVMQFTYTAVLGGGLSASVSLQDKNQFGNQDAAFVTSAKAPSRLPNLVLTVRIDQGWGHLRASAAIGQNHNATNGATGGTYNVTGWAVGADARIRLPAISRGSSLWLSAAYSDGLLDYATGGNIANGSIAKDGRVTGGWMQYNANVYHDGTSSHTWNAWRAMIAYSHRWSPTLRSNFAWSYMAINAPAALRAAAVVPNSRSWQAAAQLIWSPTRGFDIGLEVFYNQVNYNFGTGSGALSNATSAAGIDTSPSDWGAVVRVQKTW